MTEFSEELIQRCIKHFKEEHDHEFTREEAIEALRDLGGLYLAMHRISKGDKMTSLT